MIFTGKNLFRSLFFKKLQAFWPATLLKRDSTIGAFLWILRSFFENSRFEKHLQTAAFIYIAMPPYFRWQDQNSGNFWWFNVAVTLCNTFTKRFLPYKSLKIKSRGRSRTAATFKMELLIIIANDWKGSHKEESLLFRIVHSCILKLKKYIFSSAIGNYET